MNPPRNRKSEDGNPPPTTGATELYPDHVRICGGLGVKFPGPTRRNQQSRDRRLSSVEASAASCRPIEKTFPMEIAPPVQQVQGPCSLTAVRHMCSVAGNSPGGVLSGAARDSDSEPTNEPCIPVEHALPGQQVGPDLLQTLPPHSPAVSSRYPLIVPKRRWRHADELR